MIFQKPSTRTRVSFEVGMWQLGGVALYLSASDLQLGRGETVKDTALVLSRYLDAIMIRTFDQADVEELARNATIPVINGLTDSSHPCQALADAMTIRERLGRFEGVRLTYLGDGNNVCASLMVAAAKLGMHFTAAVPPGYEPDEGALDVARTAAEETGAAVRVVHDPREASEGAEVFYTDVWTSMGQEEERERRLRDLAGFGITDELLALAEDDAIVLHCLPAHYGEEITEAIAYGTAVRALGRGREPPARAEGSPRPHRALIPLKDNVPTRHFPIVTVGLIVANVLVFFLYQAPDLEGSLAELAYQPCEVNDSCPVTGERLAADLVHVDVHARQLHPPRRQHALPLDLRQQRRGRVRPRALPHLLSARRLRRDGAPDGHHALDCARLGRTSRTSARPGRSQACSARTSCSCRARRC